MHELEPLKGPGSQTVGGFGKVARDSSVSFRSEIYPRLFQPRHLAHASCIIGKPSHSNHSCHTEVSRLLLRMEALLGSERFDALFGERTNAELTYSRVSQ